MQNEARASMQYADLALWQHRKYGAHCYLKRGILELGEGRQAKPIDGAAFLLQRIVLCECYASGASEDNPE
jgi:hypothetical protein